jgi:hypothetical protein
MNRESENLKRRIALFILAFYSVVCVGSDLHWGKVEYFNFHPTDYESA